MNLKNKVEKLINKFFTYINNLNYKQKLLYSIVFAVSIFLIVKIIFENIIGNRNNIIDYKNMNGEDFYLLSYELEDDNLYVILKSIADDIIKECLEQMVDDNGVYVTRERVYNEILTSNYKDSISRREFVTVAENIANKYTNVNNNYIEFIPNNITEYEDGYYLITYNFNINGENVDVYIGVTLDVGSNQYYIWYLE